MVSDAVCDVLVHGRREHEANEQVRANEAEQQAVVAAASRRSELGRWLEGLLLGVGGHRGGQEQSRIRRTGSRILSPEIGGIASGRSTRLWRCCWRDGRRGCS